MLEVGMNRGKGRGSQRGFTLVELGVAMAISMLLIAGTAWILRYTVVQTAANADRTLAQMQTQYVSSWINQDVIQARQIHFGNTTGAGFPLTIAWTGQDGGNRTVIYDVVKDPSISQNHCQLTRELRVDGVGEGNYLVSEYMVEWHRTAEGEDLGTWCHRENAGSDTDPRYVLVLDVMARVGQSEENSTFKISPRRTDIDWY
jgi:type II secretory pathway component PulJ